MKQSERQAEFLLDVCLLIQWVDRHKNWYVTGGELHRLPWVQKQLKEQGKSNTLESNHQKRLAIDLMLFIDGEWQQDTEAYAPLGEFWESIRPENRWGGNFTSLKDGVHFERTDG